MRLVNELFDRPLKVVVPCRSISVLEMLNVQLKPLDWDAKFVEEQLQFTVGCFESTDQHKAFALMELGQELGQQVFANDDFICSLEFKCLNDELIGQGRDIFCEPVFEYYVSRMFGLSKHNCNISLGVSWTLGHCYWDENMASK